LNMATIQGWRIALRPDYASLNPAVEGDVLTPPDSSVSEPCWVWDDFRRLATITAYSAPQGAVGDGFDHWALKPLLLAEWDVGEGQRNRDQTRSSLTMPLNHLGGGHVSGETVGQISMRRSSPSST